MSLVENGNDIILIDSESDENSLPPPAKRLKPSSQLMSSFKKPFMNNSSSPSASPDEIRPQPEPSSPSESDSDDRQPQFVSDRRLPEGSSELRPSSSSESDSESDSELQEISSYEYAAIKNMEPSSEDPSQSVEEPQYEASRKIIADTRAYLKTHGVYPFLDKYLNETATSEDLLNLILNLGFLPKHIPESFDDEKLIALIKLLHVAIKKVRVMRSRLPDFYNIGHVLEKIKSANKILVITGAGISTSLGIPDFRSSKGFYTKLESLGLSDPQEVFDLEFFHTDPNIFYSIAHMILPPENVYSPLHSFIRLLQDKNKLLRNYTQNIDNLESYAGIDPEKLIQCHGSFAHATCVTCKYKVKGDKIFDSIRQKEIAYCPKCKAMRKKLLNNEDAFVPESYGVMKPDITFFGEPLPSRFHDMIAKDLFDCDLLISIGTSLKVAPVADIVEKVPPEIPQVLINRDTIDHCNFDISLLGYCDDVASYLCNKLDEEGTGNWKIPHAKYSSIVGDHGANLSVKEISVSEGVYEIINLETQAKEEEEAAEEEEEAAEEAEEAEEQEIVEEATRDDSLLVSDLTPL